MTGNLSPSLKVSFYYCISTEIHLHLSRTLDVTISSDIVYYEDENHEFLSFSRSLSLAITERL